MKEVSSDLPFHYMAAMKRKEDAVRVILSTCGELVVHGVDVDGRVSMANTARFSQIFRRINGSTARYTLSHAQTASCASGSFHGMTYWGLSCSARH